jgi:Glyoxalase-like domain
MTSRLVAIQIDSLEPPRLARFWAGLLGRQPVEHAGGVTLPGDETQVSLRFVPSGARKVGRNRVHLHVTSASIDDQQHRVAEALRLGGSHLDVGQLPEEEHVVLADPEGNEFCVIEPGNSFLAGCGLLGEVACDGSRDVGLFWQAALGWPLVWDQNEETAIQSPAGGTKVAWGGTPAARKVARNRIRFALAPVSVDHRTELARLLSLGATRLDTDEHGGVMLADPDDNEFSLSPR